MDGEGKQSEWGKRQDSMEHGGVRTWARHVMTKWGRRRNMKGMGEGGREREGGRDGGIVEGTQPKHITTVEGEGRRGMRRGKEGREKGRGRQA